MAERGSPEAESESSQGLDDTEGLLPNERARLAVDTAHARSLPTERIPERKPGRGPPSPEPESDSDSDEAESGGDPMASIRPRLPSNPPLHAPTVELGQSATGSRAGGVTSGIQPTLAPQLDLEPDTHESGPYVIPVREAADAAVDGSAERADEAAYTLLQRVGEGGMGEVWQARQRSLGRRVALKRLRKGAEAPNAIVRQFESEARLTGVLDHPNIVTVHELGHDQHDRVFYTMKLIEGTPWSRLLAENTRTTGEGKREPMELRDHLEILLEVANAIAFAHSRGVIHRDIKPGNVMVGDYGEVLVVDWGLAVAVRPIALLGGAETWTLANLPRSALVCGTPAYMSPETATADRERISPATDVYLLGAVLYHVLYGRPPHRGKTVDAVIEQAKRNAWAPPQTVPRRLRPWHVLLRPLLRRALASDPAQRFPDASGFAEALREAMRNYDSAKLANSAQEQLAKLDLTNCSPTEGYKQLHKIVARFEEALEDWPHNLAARRGLGQSHLTLAELALRHGDLGLVAVHLAAFDALPELELVAPRPREDSRVGPQARDGRPIASDQTVINAPRPQDTLVRSGSGAGTKIEGSSSEGTPALSRGSTVSPAQLLARSGSTDPQGARVRIGSAPHRTALPGAMTSASVSIEQLEHAELLEGEQELVAWAQSLRTDAAAREQAELRRRRAYTSLRVLAVALAVGVLTVGVITAWLIASERDRATEERNKLARVLMDEAATTTEAQLSARFSAARGALLTSVGWARLGLLDTDDPAQLNAYFMPLLGGVEDVATSMLRADSSGREYMLLRTSEGWQTRTTFPGNTPELRDWDLQGNLVGTDLGRRDYDPLIRPWYMGGAALRSKAERALASGDPLPVHWTEPYTFFTTGDPGISVSTPVTSPKGRQFVVAFDVKLVDISRFTMDLPRGIEQGQVFVLDANDRVLGLPKEVRDRSDDQQRDLVLDPIDTLVEIMPRSHHAWTSWVERDRTADPFRVEEQGAGYWIDFHRVEGEDRPPLWVGVVIPESHFLPEM